MQGPPRPAAPPAPPRPAVPRPVAPAAGMPPAPARPAAETPAARVATPAVEAPPVPAAEVRRELIRVPESVTVSELAEKMRRKSGEVITRSEERRVGKESRDG